MFSGIRSINASVTRTHTNFGLLSRISNVTFIERFVHFKLMSQESMSLFLTVGMPD